jgi:hypothetical protein
MQTRLPLVVLIACATEVVSSSAAADEPDERQYAPIPEPIFTETVTDIDGSERGEVELEANGAVLRALRGGAYALDASVEVEWIVLPRLGVRIEPSMASDRDDGLSAPGVSFGVSGGAALKLLQDFDRQLFVDAELLARLPWDEAAIVQPGDPALPLAADLRAGWRRGPVTLRWGAGYGGFGDAVHLPLRGSVAVLAPFESSGRFGFWGVEVDADGARTAPVVAALNVVPNFAPGGLPFRIGLALPWAIGEEDRRPSVGLFLRVFYESSREIEFAEGRSR